VRPNFRQQPISVWSRLRHEEGASGRLADRAIDRQDDNARFGRPSPAPSVVRPEEAAHLGYLVPNADPERAVHERFAARLADDGWYPFHPDGEVAVGKEEFRQDGARRSTATGAGRPALAVVAFAHSPSSPTTRRAVPEIHRAIRGRYMVTITTPTGASQLTTK
jgi:hypothetical protein